MSTKTLGVVGRGLGQQKVGIELGSGKLYPNYPHSLGMFQAKAIGSVNDGVLGEDICLHEFVLRGVDH